MDAEHVVGPEFVARFNRTLCLGSPDTEAVAGEIARHLRAANVGFLEVQGDAYTYRLEWCRADCLWHVTANDGAEFDVGSLTEFADGYLADFAAEEFYWDLQAIADYGLATELEVTKVLG